jgi:hypothetical protein
VVTGLARACLGKGHRVEVLLPFYECIPDSAVQGLEHDMDFECPKVMPLPLSLDWKPVCCNVIVIVEVS